MKRCLAGVLLAIFAVIGAGTVQAPSEPPSPAHYLAADCGEHEWSCG
ncbi:MAG: hypothetical protein HOV96_30380 [Nonomuraea sp.]|nr:hypothetical protein [Nonomuraea sp.]NUT11033.1 hypothetical protein [Nonomuraea sp.]